MGLRDLLRANKGNIEESTGKEEENIVQNNDAYKDVDIASSSIYEEENDIYAESNGLYEEENSLHEEEIDTESTVHGMYEQEYDTEDEVIATSEDLRIALSTAAKTGSNIVVTGCSGSGKTTNAYNIANLLSKLGYRTLLVDLDTEQRAQGYFSGKSFKSISKETETITSIMEEGADIEEVAAMIKNNLYLVTMGVNTDANSFDKSINVQRLSRLMTMSKTKFEFVVYDIQIDDIINSFSEGALLADKLILNIESSTWGIMKAITKVTNCEDETLLDSIFSKSHIVFTKARNRNKLLGDSFKPDGKGSTSMIDEVIFNIAGEDIGYHFGELGKASVVKYNENLIDMWYEDRQFTDTKEGKDEFEKILKDMYM